MQRLPLYAAGRTSNADIDTAFDVIVEACLTQHGLEAPRATSNG